MAHTADLIIRSTGPEAYEALIDGVRRASWSHEPRHSWDAAPWFVRVFTGPWEHQLRERSEGDAARAALFVVKGTMPGVTLLAVEPEELDDEELELAAE